MSKQQAKYDLILMDLDDTIFDFKKSQCRAFQSTLIDCGLAWQDDHLIDFNAIQGKLWRQFEQGEITKDYVFALRFGLFFDTLRHSYDSDAANRIFLDHLAAEPDLIEGAEDLCQYLSDRYPLVIVTNGDSKTQRRRLSASPVARHFPHIVISDDVGVGKPHPEIFWYALNRAGIPRESTVLMIGDNYAADIIGAQACGFDTCWVALKSEECSVPVPPTYKVSALAEICSLL